MRPGARRLLVAFGLPAALLLGAVAPAGADWLQMKDGSRVETQGAWEVRGAQVVFILPNGTYASTRAADVDFDRSRQLTAESQLPKTTPPPPPPKKSVLVLTDADLAPSPSTRAEEGAAAPSAAVSATAAGPGSSPAPAPAGAPSQAGAGGPARGAAGLEVANWSARRDLDTASTVLTGTLRNTEDTLAHGLAVEVTIFNAQDEEIGKASATPATPALAPRASTTFESRHDGLFEVANATFVLAAERVGLRPAPAPAAAQPPATAQEPPALQPPPGQAAPKLQVASWRPEKEREALSIVGELRNTGDVTAENVQLRVTILGPGGTEIANAVALLGSSLLTAGGETNFRVAFPGVGDYLDVRFDTRYNVRRQVTRTVSGRP